MLHTRCILCAFLVHRRCICCIYCICWCIASAFLLHFCCIAGAFVAFFRISYYTSTLKLFGGNCNGIRSRLPVLSNSALKTRRQTSSQYGSKNSIREREMKNVFGIRETPKSIRLHLNGILFRSKNAVLVHFGTHTTQHNTTQHENPLLKGSPSPGNRRRRPFACGGRRLRYFVVQNACHPPVGVAEKVYLCSATGQNVDSFPDIRSVSFLYRIFAAKEKITRIDP